MPDFVEIDHPCVPFMKVPVWTGTPAKASELDTAPVSDYAAGLIKWIYDTADRAEKAAAIKYVDVTDEQALNEWLDVARKEAGT